MNIIFCIDQKYKQFFTKIGLQFFRDLSQILFSPYLIMIKSHSPWIILNVSTCCL